MKRRGFALIASLLICLILFALGTGLLSKQAAQYEATMHMTQAVQARALAQAGLQDALAKASRDSEFPPLSTEDQKVFSYTEPVKDFDGNLLGAFHVNVDGSLHLKPWRILLIESEGRVGSCRYRLRGELDISAKLRTDASTDNLNVMRWIQVEDLGSL